VYFEKMLKGEAAGIWILNMQLGFYGVVISIVGLLFSHRQEGELLRTPNLVILRGC
jgi:hypothetical protein